MDQRDYRKHGRDTARQNRGQHTPSSSHLLPSISHSNSNGLIIQKNCSLQNPEKNDTSFQKYNKKLKEDKPQKNLIKNNTHSQRNKIPENKRGSKRVFRFRIIYFYTFLDNYLIILSSPILACSINKSYL
jgi:hypothetical protein